MRTKCTFFLSRWKAYPIAEPAVIREVILYENKVVVTYNFTDTIEHLKVTKERTLQVEDQIEKAIKPFKRSKSSCILGQSPPSKNVGFFRHFFFYV